MKWLQFFRKRKKLDREGSLDPGEGSLSDGEDEEEQQLAHKRRQQEPERERGPRPSLDQWFEARRARTSIDVNRTTTTDKLTVCKAGVTTLINRTYIVIKHLGSGTYGQVKLAFNIRDRKLYAIKSCRKSQYGAAMGTGTSLMSPRCVSLSRSRRNIAGMMGGQSQSGTVQEAGQQQAGRTSTSAPSQQPWARPSLCGTQPVITTAGGLNSVDVSQPGTSSCKDTPSPMVTDQPSQPANPQLLEPTGVGGPLTPFTSTQSQSRGAPPPPLFHPGPSTSRGPSEPITLEPAPVQQPGTATRSGSQPGEQVPEQTTSAPGPDFTAGAQGPGGGAWSANSWFARPRAHNNSFNSSSGASGRGQVGAQRTGLNSKGGFRYRSSAMGFDPPPSSAADAVLAQGAVAASTGPTHAQGGSEVGAAAAAGGGGGGGGGGGELHQQQAQGGVGGVAPGASQQSQLPPVQRASATGTAQVRFKAEEWIREIAIMKKLSHPNIVQLVEVIDDPGSDNLLLVMEYVEGMSLHPHRLDSNHWEAVPEHEAWRRARDVLQGLDYLHFNGVVHGDLKPANLMLDNNTRRVKIVDFGSAVLHNPGGTQTSGFAASAAGAMSCTPAFRSPESLKSGYRPSYELDMWALGVTVYMWVFGQLPFNGAAPFLIYECIRRKELVLPEGVEISRELRDFLAKVLMKDPTSRLNVVGALNHAWITGNGTAPLPIFQRHTDSGTPAAPLLPPPPRGLRDEDMAPEGGQSERGGGGGREVTRHKRERERFAPVRMLSQEELDRAISQSIGGHAISELMGMVFEEVRLSPRQQIVRAGDPVDTIYLIAQGEVEIYQELPPEEAVAAAMLLGSSTTRSRILATVLGPSSSDLPSNESLKQPSTRLAETAMLVDGQEPAQRLFNGQKRSSTDRPNAAVAQQSNGSGGGAHGAGEHGAGAAGGEGGKQPGGGTAPMELDIRSKASIEQAQHAQHALAGQGTSTPFMLEGGGFFQQFHAAVGAGAGGVAGAGGANATSPNAVTALQVHLEHKERQQAFRDHVPATLHHSLETRQRQQLPWPLPPQYLQAAASLAQPIISGLGPGHRKLLSTGPQVQGVQGLPQGAVQGTAQFEYDEEEETESFLDERIVPMLSSAFGSDGKEAGGSGTQPLSAHAYRHQLSYLHTSSHLGSGAVGGAPVLILAVKGPGDTLGFASLEPTPAAGAGGGGAAGGEAVVSGHDSQGRDSARPCAGQQGSGGGGSGTGSLHAPDFPLNSTPQPGSGMGSSQPALDLGTGIPVPCDTSMLTSEAVVECCKPPAGPGLPGAAAARAGMSCRSPALAVPPPALTWSAHVRTLGDVVAFKADVQRIQKLTKEFPELEAAMKHIAVQQETDLLVSEALRQLRLVSAAIPAHLGHGPGPSGPGPNSNSNSKHGSGATTAGSGGSTGSGSQGKSGGGLGLARQQQLVQ